MKCTVNVIVFESSPNCASCPVRGKLSSTKLVPGAKRKLGICSKTQGTHLHLLRGLSHYWCDLRLFSQPFYFSCLLDNLSCRGDVKVGWDKASKTSSTASKMWKVSKYCWTDWSCLLIFPGVNPPPMVDFKLSTLLY